MTPRTGRPPLGDKARNEILRVRVTPDEDALIRAAAERAGESIADWCRARLVAAAKRSR